MAITSKKLYSTKTHNAHWSRDEIGRLTAKHDGSNYITIVVEQKNPSRQMTAHIHKHNLSELLQAVKEASND